MVLNALCFEFGGLSVQAQSHQEGGDGVMPHTALNGQIVTLDREPDRPVWSK